MKSPIFSSEFKMRRINELTGIFVIAVIVLVIAVIVWTSRSQRWFKSTATFRIILPEAGAAGIRQGSEVYFLGTLVGNVTDVVVDQKGSMQAYARIRKDFFLFVRTDSSAIVKKKFGVAGDSFFEIIRGEGKPLPEANAAIFCNEQFQSSLELAIEELRAQATLILSNANTGINIWAELGSDLRLTAWKLDELADSSHHLLAGVSEGEGSLGSLVTDSSLHDAGLELLRQSQEFMRDASGSVSNLNAAIDQVQLGLVHVPAIFGAIGAEAKDLPGLVRQTQTSMKEMERVIVAIQKHWILRKYVADTNPPPTSSLKAKAAPRKTKRGE